MGDLAGGARAAHAAAFYDSTAGFIGCARAFVDQGLEAADAVLVAVPGSSMDLLREHLVGDGGQVSWADMARIGANPARIIPAIRAFASSQQGRPVRCLAQSLWSARTAEQRRETIRHEALINLAFADVPVSILCPYDVTLADAGIARSAELTHPVLVRDGSERPSLTYDAGSVFPADCDGPLDPAPSSAAVLAYRDDLRTVRAFVAEHASGAAVAPDRVTDLVIAVSELAANTYRHTGAGGTLSIWVTATEMICQVQDSGHISDPLIGRRRPAGDVGGGQGMWVVHQLCDLVEIRSTAAGTQIRVHMQVLSAPSGDGASLDPTFV